MTDPEPIRAGISWWARGADCRAGRTVGFRYQYNPQTKLYAHAAGIVVVTPDGRVARYFYGIDYPPKDLRERDQASGGRPDRLADRPAAAAVLRLRRGDRQIHALDRPADPRPRDRDGPVAGHVYLLSCSAASEEVARRVVTTRVAIESARIADSSWSALLSRRTHHVELPAVPEQASTNAGRVDALFLFELADRRLLHGPDLRPDPLLRRPLPARVEGRPLQPAAHEPPARGRSGSVIPLVSRW